MDVVTYYDMLIDENNDPVNDPPVMTGAHNKFPEAALAYLSPSGNYF